MTNLAVNKLWNEYVETTRYIGKPVKLDAVLQLRMKAFIKARELKFSQIEA